jgi:drug/metabolite transporter (DMT)-like permease
MDASQSQPPSPAAEEAHRLSPAVRGILWMLLGVAGLAAVVLSVRGLKTMEMSTLQILFLRAAVGIAVIAPIALRSGPANIRTTRPGYHFGRNAVHLAGQFCVFYGIIHIPLAVVTSLEFTVPIWSAILAGFWIGETVRAHRWIGMAVSFIGVLLIIRPGVNAVDPAVFVVLLGAFAFAVQNVMVKVLTRTDSASSVVFWMNVTQAALALPFALWVWAPVGWHHVPWIVALGIAGMVAHYAMTRALAVADLSLVFPFDFLRMPLLAVVAWVVWGEVFSPWAAVGALVIFASSYWVATRESRINRAARAAAATRT